MMEKRTDIWQTESGCVFKLREGRGFDKDGTRSMENEYYFNVQVAPTKDSTPAADAYKAKFLAEFVADVLNKAPDMKVMVNTVSGVNSVRGE